MYQMFVFLCAQQSCTPTVRKQNKTKIKQHAHGTNMTYFLTQYNIEIYY